MLQIRFEYSAGGVFEPRLPPAPWTPADSTIGGSRTSATGVPAAYVVRRDALVELVLRLDEDEWTDFVNLLIWGQQGESFLWYPDAAQPLEFFEVYLEAPAAGERVQPERTEFLRVYDVTITLRGVDLPPWPNYFE